MKYDMNYIQFLSGVISEEEFRGEEPVNELFGFGKSDAVAQTEPLTALQITSFLKAEITKLAKFVEPDQIEELNAVHHDTMALTKDIENVMGRINSLKYPQRAYAPSGSSRRSDSSSRIMKRRSSASPRGLFGFGGA
jgi:hypothetical protein